MLTVDHRGFSPLPESIETIKLDASLAADLKWSIDPKSNQIMWELDFNFKTLSLPHLSTYQLAVKHFSETVWERYQNETIGVILYRGDPSSFLVEDLAEYLHHLAAYLPTEVFPFALLDRRGDPMMFSKELFSHIHLGFRSNSFGPLEWGETLKPLRHDGKIGVALPLREKGLQFDVLDRCLSELNQPYRLIAEPNITEEWDELKELIIFPELISSWGMRMVKGFEASGGKINEYK